jgi:hypothetical protein
MRMVIQLWTAKPIDALRIPAIHELAGSSLYQYATMNPLASTDKLMNRATDGCRTRRRWTLPSRGLSGGLAI